MIESKVWGHNKSIFNSPNFQLKRVSIDTGGYSSKHCHKFKYNGFFIESGALKITQWDNDDISFDQKLQFGEGIIIPPLVYHRFEALTYVICYEYYFTESSDDDIVRIDTGGNFSSKKRSPGIST
tara:strand:- start:6139 stop:6513 length:375 start_codon:yes stop_codon:yes gene_type:complete